MKEVIVYTDGACSNNPGPGGWAAVLLYGSNRKEIFGGEAMTTNNRMELTAVIEALRHLKESCEVKVHSDSAYIVNCFKDKWYINWQRRGWRKSDNKPVENADLWQQLLSVITKHKVEFIKVKGHSDNELNNRCDLLARQAVPR